MKKLSASILVFLLVVFCSLSVFASPGDGVIPDDRQLPLVVDDANLLSDSEEAELNTKLEGISASRKCDVAVVTVDSLEGKPTEAFADDFFDYNGYGYGTDNSGILLLLSMEDRDWAISTTGSAIQTFTDRGQRDITDLIVPYLSDGEYYAAFDKFASLCDEYLAHEDETGKAYDSGNTYEVPAGEKSFPYVYILGSVVLGFAVALAVTLIMKGKLKSVRGDELANNYMLRESLKVNGSRDLFLYHTVSRVKRETESSGSSTHIGSSGVSHGGSSGHF